MGQRKRHTAAFKAKVALEAIRGEKTANEPRKCIVEVKNTDLDNDWHRVGSATICFLKDRAGIYFDMSDVDGANARLLIEDYPPQVLGDITHVRITAIIKSDERVTYEAARQDSAASSQTITETRRDESYRWIKRHESSAYASGTELVRNDATEDGPMDELASRLRKEREALGLDLTLTIPWVDFTYRVGDRVKKIDGRHIPLQTKHGDDSVYPVVREITYDFKAQETNLHFRPQRLETEDQTD